MRHYLFSAIAVFIALSLLPLTPAAPVQLDKPLPNFAKRPHFAADEVIIKFHKGLDLTSLDFAKFGVAKYKQLAHQEVKARELDIAGTANPVEIMLRIGDDAGTATVRLEGKLEFEEDEEEQD